MRKKIFLVILGAVLMYYTEGLIQGALFINKQSAAYAEDRPENKSEDNKCIDSEFGVKFKCTHQWKWKRIDNAILIIVSEHPTVTLTISRVNSPIKFLNQLTAAELTESGLYADGFKTEFVMLAGKRALYVKAYSKFDENIRLADYYYIHHNKLYAVLFSVNPKDNWNQVSGEIKAIKNSFEFID